MFRFTVLTIIISIFFAPDNSLSLVIYHMYTKSTFYTIRPYEIQLAWDITTFLWIISSFVFCKKKDEKKWRENELTCLSLWMKAKVWLFLGSNVSMIWNVYHDAELACWFSKLLRHSITVLTHQSTTPRLPFLDSLQADLWLFFLSFGLWLCLA